MTTTGILGSIVADATVIRAASAARLTLFIGLIVDHAGMILAVHNPTDDAELDDPGLLTNAPDSIRMVKVERAKAFMSLVRRWKRLST